MPARGRVASITEWDPTEDFDDFNTSGRSMNAGQLDHTKLYITNVPHGLNSQGLRTAFEAYGQLQQVFLSNDPLKKYGLVRYETAAEARIAMMKLNRTEPLNLHVHIARASSSNRSNYGDHGHRDNASVVSSTRDWQARNQEELLNEEVEQMDEQMGLDHNLHLELEKMKLDKLRIQEEQVKCRQKMMLLQLQKRPNMTPAPVSSSRRLLPDGRVIVQERVQDPDSSFIAGAGDSLSIPGLQREREQACIVCGARADLFCARCAVAPYCAEPCQRQDWVKRHSAVCHNLIRLHSGRSTATAAPADVTFVANTPVPAPPAPLRRPRSPGPQRRPLSPAEAHGSPSEARGSTSEARGSTSEARGSTSEARGSTSVARGSTSEARGSTQRTGALPNGNKGFGKKSGGQAAHYVNNNKTKFIPPGHHPPAHAHAQRADCGPRSSQDSQQNGNEDEGWGSSDKKTTKQAPVQSSRLNNHSPKVAVEMLMPQAKVEAALTKVEAAQAKVKASQPKLEAKLNSNTSQNMVYETRGDVKPRSPPAALVLVPSQFIVETLPIGESFLLSVEQPAVVCATKQAGFVCLAMHARHEGQYTSLLDDIFDGERNIVPRPGATFAFLASDEGWYRARCLSPARCALLDGSRVADLSAQSVCRALAPKYADIPEFCCVLDGKAEVGMSLKCTILMKTAGGYKVSMDSATEDRYMGEGLVTRWAPEVESPPPPKPFSVQARLKQDRVESSPTPNMDSKPEAVSSKLQAIPNKTQAVPNKPEAVSNKPQAVLEKVQKPSIPDIPRPDIVNNGKYLLLHVTSLARACVRPCDDETTAEFENVIQDVALYGIQNGKRLGTPPTPGDVVLCHYDGVHYRALVTRTKAAENRYKVQYAEYGNEEIVALEKLFVCPPELSLAARPARASFVVISATQCQLTPPAVEYADSLKEETELVATIPSGEKSAPSGSLVTLCVAKNKENVNKKLEAMCTPDWKKLEQAGGDVIDSDVILYSSIETLPLPTSRPFVLEVTDIGYIERGLVCGYEHGVALPDYVYGPLTDKINEYCNSTLCSKSYLPMVEEVCLAKLEPYPQWFRAVVVSHRPGAATAAVLYIDYGNMSTEVPVAHLRKCMPEFARDPALAATGDIKGWPKNPSQEQLQRAIEFLGIDDEGRGGRLPVARCYREEDLTFVLEVPELIAAINM